MRQACSLSLSLSLKTLLTAFRPLALVALVISASFWISIAIATDTAFYIGPEATTSFRALFEFLHTTPIITPINNVLYNTKASNLKAHGLHPHYQHLLINLPQLLGPALLLLFPLPLRISDFGIDRMLHNPRLTAAITGSVILSAIPHQEPRFLLPCIPLILTCVSIPESRVWRKRFWVAWAVFNGAMSILMGVYHQGGIIPIQLAIPDIIRSSMYNTQSITKAVEVHWWKTYPPSLYMLGPPTSNPITNDTINILTTPLLGANKTTLFNGLTASLPTCENKSGLLSRLSNAVASPQGPPQVLLVAPLSAWRFDREQTIPPLSNFSFSLPAPPTTEAASQHHLRLTHLKTYSKHINLDDMDFGDDGVIPTLTRVVGRRGLGVWRVEKECVDDETDGSK